MMRGVPELDTPIRGKPDRILILVAILFVGFAARVATFRSPLLDHHSWRQADTAAMARNFLRDRFNPFYPQVDQRGAQPVGYVETGLELFAFAVAGVSRLAGFHHEIGRVLNCFAFLGSAVLLFLFLRDRYGPRYGLVGAAVYAFGFPLLVFIERAFMNEASLLLLTIASYRLTQRHLAAPSRGRLLGLVLCTTLIAVLKIPYMIVWAGIAGLVAERDGWRSLRRVDLLLVGFVNLAAAFLWYSHAHSLAAETGLTFGMTDKLYSSSVVFSTLFLRRVGGQIRQDVLGLPAVLLLLVGLVVAARRGKRFELFALGGVLAYIVILAQGCMVHDYYLLAIVPVASVLVPLGLCAAAKEIGGGRHDRELLVTFALVALLAMYTLFRSVGAHSWYDIPVEKLQLCRVGPTFLGAGDRLVFLDYGNPDLLYCLDRRGWLLDGEETNSWRLAEAWRSGGTVFVIPRTVAGTPVDRWVRERGTTDFENSGFAVVRLPPRPSADEARPDRPGPLAGFGWLRDLAGSCWAAELPDGKLRSTQCYEIRFGRFLARSIRLDPTTGADEETEMAAALPDGAGFEGESICGVEEGGRISCWSWGNDGEFSSREYFADGDLFHYPLPRRGPARPERRITWSKLDQDRFQLSREKKGREGWTELSAVVYTRVAR
jgi:hypothetical protein